MKKRQVQIMVLCEDDAHESFITGYLSNRGYNTNKIRISKPSTGSGKEFVRREYAGEVAALRRYRQKNQSQSIALLVLIDQDTPSQPDSYTDLDSRLSSAGQPVRGVQEPIVIFSTKRNIETWAYHLNDQESSVNETTDYTAPRFNIDIAMCQKAGRIFCTYLPHSEKLPFLDKGFVERQRIP